MSRLLGIVLVLLAFLVPVEASRISRRALDGFGDTLGLQASLPHPSRAANSYAVVAQDTARFADAGGNVTALVNANQQVVGRYLHDAYGGLIGMSGPMSEVNRYRFSSKEIDPTSGLYSFGYRFYAAEFQRWLNRDPIEEDGGINLFGYVGNDPVNEIDSDGLTIWRLEPGHGGWHIQTGDRRYDARTLKPVTHLGRTPSALTPDELDEIRRQGILDRVRKLFPNGVIAREAEAAGSGMSKLLTLSRNLAKPLCKTLSRIAPAVAAAGVLQDTKTIAETSQTAGQAAIAAAQAAKSYFQMQNRMQEHILGDDLSDDEITHFYLRRLNK